MVGAGSYGSVARARAGADPRVTPVSSTLARELEELGLSPYEARILLALLRLGSGTSVQLATLGKVPRSSSYGILDDLEAKGLVERVPTQGPAMWTSRGRDEVLSRLHGIQEERLLQHRDRTERVREMLAQAVPEGPAAELPFVKVTHDPAETKRVYEQLVRSAQVELLVFNRPPYSWATDEGPNPEVMKMLARGVPTRVLYQATEVDAVDAVDWHRVMAAYHEAGVTGRIVDHLPMKLAVADRKVALLSLEHPTLSNVGYPTSMHVEHPGFAGLQADAFEHRWPSARPYPGSRRR